MPQMKDAVRLIQSAAAYVNDLESDDMSQSSAYSAASVPLPSAGAGSADARSVLLQALREALSGVTVQMDGEAVGELVASSVSSEIGRAARARRFG